MICVNEGTVPGSNIVAVSLAADTFETGEPGGSPTWMSQEDSKWLVNWL